VGGLLPRLALKGNVEDLTGEQVTDLDGEVLDVGEACTPGHAIGAVGVAEHIFRGGLEGRGQRIQ
jgi:hypothetical protein